MKWSVREDEGFSLIELIDSVEFAARFRLLGPPYFTCMRGTNHDVMRDVPNLLNLVAAYLISLGGILTTPAQNNTVQTLSKGSLRAITVVALDHKDHLVTGLSTEGIEVIGVSAVPLRIEKLTGPVRILMLLDLSASTHHTSIRQQNTLRAAQELVKHKDKGDLVELHVFAERHLVLAKFTDDADSMRKILDSLRTEDSATLEKKVGTKTAVISALEKSLESARKDLHFGDAVVLVSDGEYYDLDHKRLYALQREVVRAGLRIYLLHTAELLTPRILGSFPPGWRRPESVQRSTDMLATQAEAMALNIVNNMRDLVLPTGGAILSATEQTVYLRESDHEIEQNRLKAVAAILANLIHGAYRLELEIREPVTKPRRFILRFSKKGAGRSVDIQCPQWMLSDDDFTRVLQNR